MCLQRARAGRCGVGTRGRLWTRRARETPHPPLFAAAPGSRRAIPLSSPPFPLPPPSSRLSPPSYLHVNARPPRPKIPTPSEPTRARTARTPPPPRSRRDPLGRRDRHEGRYGRRNVGWRSPAAPLSCASPLGSARRAPRPRRGAARSRADLESSRERRVRVGALARSGAVARVRDSQPPRVRIADRSDIASSFSCPPGELSVSPSPSLPAPRPSPLRPRRPSPTRAPCGLSRASRGCVAVRAARALRPLRLGIRLARLRRACGRDPPSRARFEPARHPPLPPPQSQAARGLRCYSQKADGSTDAAKKAAEQVRRAEGAGGGSRSLGKEKRGGGGRGGAGRARASGGVGRWGEGERTRKGGREGERGWTGKGGERGGGKRVCGRVAGRPSPLVLRASARVPPPPPLPLSPRFASPLAEPHPFPFFLPFFASRR